MKYSRISFILILAFGLFSLVQASRQIKPCYRVKFDVDYGTLPQDVYDTFCNGTSDERRVAIFRERNPIPSNIQRLYILDDTMEPDMVYKTDNHTVNIFAEKEGATLSIFNMEAVDKMATMTIDNTLKSFMELLSDISSLHFMIIGNLEDCIGYVQEGTSLRPTLYVTSSCVRYAREVRQNSKLDSTNASRLLLKKNIHEVLAYILHVYYIDSYPDIYDARFDDEYMKAKMVELLPLHLQRIFIRFLTIYNMDSAMRLLGHPFLSGLLPKELIPGHEIELPLFFNDQFFGISDTASLTYALKKMYYYNTLSSSNDNYIRYHRKFTSILELENEHIFFHPVGIRADPTLDQLNAYWFSPVFEQLNEITIDDLGYMSNRQATELITGVLDACKNGICVDLTSNSTRIFTNGEQYFVIPGEHSFLYDQVKDDHFQFRMSLVKLLLYIRTNYIKCSFTKKMIENLFNDNVDTLKELRKVEKSNVFRELLIEPKFDFDVMSHNIENLIYDNSAYDSAQSKHLKKLMTCDITGVRASNEGFVPVIYTEMMKVLTSTLSYSYPDLDMSFKNGKYVDRITGKMVSGIILRDINSTDLFDQYLAADACKLAYDSKFIPDYEDVVFKSHSVYMSKDNSPRNNRGYTGSFNPRNIPSAIRPSTSKKSLSINDRVEYFSQYRPPLVRSSSSRSEASSFISDTYSFYDDEEGEPICEISFTPKVNLVTGSRVKVKPSKSKDDRLSIVDPRVDADSFYNMIQLVSAVSENFMIKDISCVYFAEATKPIMVGSKISLKSDADPQSDLTFMDPRVMYTRDCLVSRFGQHDDMFVSSLELARSLWKARLSNAIYFQTATWVDRILDKATIDATFYLELISQSRELVGDMIAPRLIDIILLNSKDDKPEAVIEAIVNILEFEHGKVQIIETKADKVEQQRLENIYERFSGHSQHLVLPLINFGLQDKYVTIWATSDITYFNGQTLKKEYGSSAHLSTLFTSLGTVLASLSESSIDIDLLNVDINMFSINHLSKELKIVAHQSIFLAEQLPFGLVVGTFTNFYLYVRDVISDHSLVGFEAVNYQELPESAEELLEYWTVVLGSRPEAEFLKEVAFEATSVPIWWDILDAHKFDVNEDYTPGLKLYFGKTMKLDGMHDLHSVLVEGKTFAPITDLAYAVRMLDILEKNKEAFNITKVELVEIKIAFQNVKGIVITRSVEPKDYMLEWAAYSEVGLAAVDLALAAHIGHHTSYLFIRDFHMSHKKFRIFEQFGRTLIDGISNVSDDVELIEEYKMDMKASMISENGARITKLAPYFVLPYLIIKGNKENISALELVVGTRYLDVSLPNLMQIFY